jgi:hypothetical protein
MVRLDQPCVSFAAIAAEFGVTRECVRQWQQQFRPGSPTGRERLAQCRRLRARRRLLSDPLFRAFYQHARAHLDAGRIAPIPSTDGYRLRTVKIDRHVVLLREGVEALTRLHRRGRETFVYVRIDENVFFFVPAGAVASGAEDALLAEYRNSFAAIDGVLDSPVVNFVCESPEGPV